MPVSGRFGLIPKLTGGSETSPERDRDPVGQYRTASPGPSIVLGPPLALAGILACRDGRPGPSLNQRTSVSALTTNCHFRTVPTRAAIHAEWDPLRSGQEILT